MSKTLLPHKPAPPPLPVAPEPEPTPPYNPSLHDEREETAREVLSKLETWRLVSVIAGEVKRRVDEIDQQHHGFYVNISEPFDGEEKLAALYLLTKDWL